MLLLNPTTPLSNNFPEREAAPPAGDTAAGRVRGLCVLRAGHGHAEQDLPHHLHAGHAQGADGRQIGKVGHRHIAALRVQAGLGHHRRRHRAGDVPEGAPPQARLRQGGGNSIDIFWLEFWLEKPLEIWLEKPLQFWLEIPCTNKKFTIG